MQLLAKTKKHYGTTEIEDYKIAFHSKADINMIYRYFFCFCDLDLDPITVIYELDLDISKMSLHATNARSRSRHSKFRA